jgi:hypothetical protein
MYKPIKINPKTKIIKVNNLMLNSSSVNSSINRLLYSFDFRNGINHNVPSNIIDLVFFSDNGFSYDYFNEIQTLL